MGIGVGLQGGTSLSGPPFRHTIDFTYFNLWHYDGRTSKHGAFMGGADFVQWHGNYELLSKTVELQHDADGLRRESVPTSKLLLRLQSILRDTRLEWVHDPQLWAELFVTANLAILAADIYIAHSVNHFQKAAEYIPLYFSIGAPAVLACMIALRWIGHFEAPWRDVEPGYSLFDRLVNGAPPMAPLLFPNLAGLALIGMWALLPHLQQAAPGRSWLGATYDWAHPGEESGATRN